MNRDWITALYILIFFALLLGDFIPSRCALVFFYASIVFPFTITYYVSCTFANMWSSILIGLKFGVFSSTAEKFLLVYCPILLSSPLISHSSSFKTIGFLLIGHRQMLQSETLIRLLKQLLLVFWQL